ncbi:MAG: hypothetical protein ACRD2J_06135 [Thermoanaerobaculia bacterium]
MRFRTAAVMAAAMLASTAGLAREVNVDVRTRGAVESCADVEFEFDGVAGARAEDRLQIGGNALAVNAGDGHGIPVKIAGSNRSGYEVLLCKGAEDSATLGAVRLQQQGTEISVVGPAMGEWSAYLVVFAPRNADLDVEAANGPVSIRDIAGRLRAQIANGPLSLRGVAGQVDAQASNGPISFHGSSGDVSLQAMNGPISVHLESTTWEGGELRTSAKNGPVTLHVPEGYASGIVVERRARTPFRCPAELCGDRPEFFRDDQTQIAIGYGAPRVHVAAKNGPISIKRAD